MKSKRTEGKRTDAVIYRVVIENTRPDPGLPNTSPPIQSTVLETLRPELFIVPVAHVLVVKTSRDRP
eukprot:scaffold156752_cov33-Tisochrysis_lutea.AAC.3